MRTVRWAGIGLFLAASGCTRPVAPAAAPAPVASSGATPLWQGIQQALARASTLHIHCRYERPDRRPIEEDLWFDGDRWGYLPEGASPTFVFDGQNFCRAQEPTAFGADPVLVLTRNPAAVPAAARRIVPALKRTVVEAGIAPVALPAEAAPLRVMPSENATADGRSWLRLGKIGATHFGTELWIDPRRLRPEREIVGEGAGRRTILTIRYEVRPRPNLTALARPGWRVVDLDRYERQWRQRTLAKIALAGGEVNVHAFQVSRAGDVFLLFTGDLPAPLNTRRLPSGQTVRRRFVVRLEAEDGARYLGGEQPRTLTRSGLRLLVWTPARNAPSPPRRRLRVIFAETWEEDATPRRKEQVVPGVFSSSRAADLPGFLTELGYRPASEAPARVDLHLIDWLRRPEAIPDPATLRAVFQDAMVAGAALPGNRWFQLYQHLARAGQTASAQEALRQAAKQRRTREVEDALQREGM